MNYITNDNFTIIVDTSPINSPKTIAKYTSIQIQDDKFQLQPGDLSLQRPVMGIFGHCSIAIDDKTILQIEAWRQTNYTILRIF